MLHVTDVLSRPLLNLPRRVLLALAAVTMEDLLRTATEADLLPKFDDGYDFSV